MVLGTATAFFAIVFVAIVVAERKVATARREVHGELRAAFGELVSAVGRLEHKLEPRRTRRTAVVRLDGMHVVHDDEHAGWECQGQKLELLPGESLTVQLIPQRNLQAGSIVSVDAPGFYMQSVQVGTLLVGKWTRAVHGLPPMRHGVCVTATIFRVGDEP